MTRDVTEQTVGINLDAKYRPYTRANVEYPSDKTIQRILSGDLPKEYKHFSKERIDNLIKQAALVDQGYGHLLITDNHFRGLDGQFNKKSSEARQAWLANNPEWREKSFSQIDREILRRSYQRLGISNPDHPDGSFFADKYFLASQNRVLSVKTEHERSKQEIALAYSGIYAEVFANFKSEVAHARALFKKGKLDESQKAFNEAKEHFNEIAIPLGRSLKSKAIFEQWVAKVDHTTDVYDKWRTRPAQAA